MERVLRAVGVPAYVLQCERLLVRYRMTSADMAATITVHGIYQSVGDLPGFRSEFGTHAWRKAGKPWRRGGKPHTVLVRACSCAWVGGKRVDYLTKYSDEQLKWLR